MASPTDPQGGTQVPIFKQSDSAPFIYFDLAPTFGTLAGAIQIELAARILTPTQDVTGASAEFVTTAHLRCSPGAVVHLRDAIDKCLQMLKDLHEQGEATQAAAAGKLN